MLPCHDTKVLPVGVKRILVYFVCNSHTAAYVLAEQGSYINTII